MAVPDYQTLMRPVLAAFADGETTVRAILPRLQRELGLSDDDAQELLPSGKKTLLADRAHWARTYLSKAGCLQSPRRSHHVITPRGRALLERHPEAIDNKVLTEFEEFQEWLGESRARKEPPDRVPNLRIVQTPVSETPQDQIDRAAREISDALVDEVLTNVLQLDPKRFERLILDVLRAMGYGGGVDADYRATPASNDGGIDGIINEDALGLDAVYIQAKKYAPENKVGREALQAFVGSLTGEGASKGVFVTTSGFSRHAVDYAARLQNQRVVLIDGDRLARLMIAHDVGVRAAQTYVIKEIDENYFPDD